MKIELEPELRQAIGMRIHRARRALGLSQMDFAYYLDADQCTVSRWEAGRYLPDAFDLYRISALSHRPLEWFFKD